MYKRQNSYHFISLFLQHDARGGAVYSATHSYQDSFISEMCIRDRLGAMYWDYDSDDEKGTLRHAVYQGVMNP